MSNNRCLLILLAAGFVGGCSSEAMKGVYAEGGHMGTIGLGLPMRDEVHFSQPGFDDTALTRVYPSLLKLKVRFISFENVPITDSSIQLIRELGTIEELVFIDTQVTITGISKLKGMPRLRRLLLDGRRYTEEQVEQLRHDMPAVEILVFT